MHSTERVVGNVTQKTQIEIIPPPGFIGGKLKCSATPPQNSTRCTFILRNEVQTVLVHIDHFRLYIVFISVCTSFSSTNYAT